MPVALGKDDSGCCTLGATMSNKQRAKAKIRCERRQGSRAMSEQSGFKYAIERDKSCRFSDLNEKTTVKQRKAEI